MLISRFRQQMSTTTPITEHVLIVISLSRRAPAPPRLAGALTLHMQHITLPAL